MSFLARFFKSLQDKPVLGGSALDFTQREPVEKQVERALMGGAVAASLSVRVKEVVLREELGSLNIYLVTEIGEVLLHCSHAPASYWLGQLHSGSVVTLRVNGLKADYEVTRP